MHVEYHLSLVILKWINVSQDAHTKRLSIYLIYLLFDSNHARIFKFPPTAAHTSEKWFESAFRVRLKTLSRLLMSDSNLQVSTLRFRPNLLQLAFNCAVLVLKRAPSSLLEIFCFLLSTGHFTFNNRSQRYHCEFFICKLCSWDTFSLMMSDSCE